MIFYFIVFNTDVTNVDTLFMFCIVQIRQSKGLITTECFFIFVFKYVFKMKNIAILVPETSVVEGVADPR